MPINHGWESGVYCWLNRVNGKRYVGSAAGKGGLLRRFREYQRGFAKNRCHNRHLEHSWNKYGRKAFAFLILERCSPILCLEREQYWIEFYNSADSKFGYNLSPTAGSVLGVKWTLSARKRQSIIASNRPFPSLETRERMSEVGKRRWDDAERARMSAIHKKRYQDPIAKATLLAMNAKAMKTLRGRKRPIKEKERIRAGIIKAMATEAVKANIKIGQARRVANPELKKKISAGVRKALSADPSIRERMSIAQRKRFAK